MTARMMEHEEAIKNLAAERYLLGELTESEREAYEEHLFSCAACFAQVKAGAEFVGEIRRMGAEELRPEAARARWFHSLRSLLRPAPAFALAACILAGSTIYQNVITIPMLKAPQVEPRYSLQEQTRGKTVVDAPRNRRIRLAIEFRRPKDFASYEAQIQSPDGKVRYSVPLPPSSQDSVELSLYSGMLQPGKYVLVVYGKDGDSRQELASDPFELQFRD